MFSQASCDMLLYHVMIEQQIVTLSNFLFSVFCPCMTLSGCKLLQACALGDKKRVEALLRVNRGHVNFRD